MFKKTIIVLLLFLPLITFAQEEIEFPVPELGNCTSHEECRSYCDDQSHLDECLDFAVKIGKMPEEKAERIKMMSSGDFTGPGDCTSPEECKEFCEKEENMEECIQFDVDSGFMSQEKADKILERARNREQLEEGPGGCKSREECEAYCDNPDNVVECLDFAVAQGRMAQENADKIIEKVQERQMLKEKEKEDPEFSFEEGPGGCSSEEECNEYCNKDENLEECLDFEVEQGGMTREKANEILKRERAKMAETKKGIESILEETGGGPGGCMTPEECSSYCDQEENGEECLEFAKEHGLMTEEKAERIKKGLTVSETLGDQGGPGGCRSKEECKEYCDQEENREECINFGRDHGMMTSEKAQQLKEQMAKKKELQEMGGPGGCKSKEECEEYCSKEENREECINFGKEHGMITSEKAKKIQVLQERKKEREEIMEKKGEPPADTEIRTEKDMNRPRDIAPDEEMRKRPEDRMPPEGKEFPEGEMPEGEMPEKKEVPGEQGKMESPGLFQGFFNQIRNFINEENFIAE